MDTGKAKPTLREAYDAARNGEAFQILKKSTLNHLQSTRFKAEGIGVGAGLVVCFRGWLVGVANATRECARAVIH